MAASPDTKKQNNEPATEPMSLEEQRKRLRQLIALGKERGYLTYAEINDHLPEDVSDAEQLDGLGDLLEGERIHGPAADVLVVLQAQGAGDRAVAVVQRQLLVDRGLLDVLERLGNQLDDLFESVG